MYSYDIISPNIISIIIIDTYKRYQKLKAELVSGQPGCHGNGNSAAAPAETPAEEEEKEGVFGGHLNKKERLSKEAAMEAARPRPSVWKLRKWTRNHGYQTVRVREGEERESNGGIDGGGGGGGELAPSSLPDGESSCDSKGCNPAADKVGCETHTQS